MAAPITLIACERRRTSGLPRTARTWIIVNLALWAAFWWLVWR